MKPTASHLALVMPLLALAGCVAAALAQGDQDRIFLNDGTVLAGQIVEATGGKYWLLLPDGSMTSAAFEDIARVEKATTASDPASDPATAPAAQPAPQAAQAQPAAQAPAPPVAIPAYAAEDDDDDDEPRSERKARRGIGGGFDLGLVTAGRLRFHVETAAINNIDVRLGLGPAVAMPYFWYAYPVFFVNPQVGFFGDAPVHLVVGAALGVDSNYGYGFGGFNIAADFDANGPFHAEVGGIIGSVAGYPAVIPDISIGWVW